ncbi:MAG: DNA-directed RNA polymerase subunit beta' [Calditrichaceae bacterium]|nr:DNA-directed RNA polymerase subunit beta' [Calditrichaceae bacterium]MBN2708409.1 DNA-directed RNA polymerase subunit beta' [Calditrichaceae bacterium]RQV94623.1 MAG: DNA-directed RNA polymerase subunit beta' [Calditrichota bacterium]
MNIKRGPNKFSKIVISLASPNDILEQSYGEVTKPETINYRSFKPEKDGLFCEKIFGPVKDWECHCGKYKRIRYKGIICDRCGVEVTQKKVRRERMGHISLAVPVVHIWFFRSLPSKIGYLLDMSPKDLEKVIYYENYIVVNPGKSKMKFKQLITEEEYFDQLDAHGEMNDELADDDPEKFVARIGGEAVHLLLKMLNIEELSYELRKTINTESSEQKKLEALKRLKVVEAFRVREKNTEYRNKPEWMVLDVIPVIPPELRPLVPLEGGRFATSDLNDLYRRVIIRNNRLKKLLEIKAPEVILRNEKRMLQESVDSLFDNSKRAAAMRSDGDRPLKSLSDMLKGKQGRFRQNLLGKRVDYSGRSVIVVGPELKLHECGLPKDMAIELYKPFIIRKLVERRYVKTVKSAKKLVERRGPEVWDILEEIIEDHPVLLNRAPTLHRLGIQAFQPVLIEGKAIRIHPLVCAAFNADFDGDQMAVHIPLSYEAQIETKMLMLSSHNILSPSSGKPIAVPSQDIVLGCYYLTKMLPEAKGEGMVFASSKEVISAYNDDKIELHARIIVRINGEKIETTTGRVLFNQIVPEEIGYVNELLSKKSLTDIISDCYRIAGNKITAGFLDALKELGFTYSMKSGVSVGLSDVVVPPEKFVMVQMAQKEVDEIQGQYERGIITDGERYNKIIDIWTRITADVAETMFSKLRTNRNGFNPLYMMSDSGARGSKEQIRQLAGMRGLMAKPQKSLTGQTGEIIENPITANFLEGLSVIEYFISTHGARKGLADTALKTADAGYLTRRLVDVAQDVIVNEYDCGTILGQDITDLKEGEEIIEPLADRVLGRVLASDLVDPVTRETLAKRGDMVDEKLAELITKSSIDVVRVRTELTCEAKHGICALCYGRNLATGDLVNVGEAVGVMAAQSIGEPGTQLTLRTFHIGGTAAHIAAESHIASKVDGKIKAINIKAVKNVRDESVVIGRNGKIEVLDNDNRTISTYNVPYGATLSVDEGMQVQRGSILFNWDPYSSVIIADKSGKIEFKDIIENVTYREELDEQTGRKQRVIVESKNKNLNPHVYIVDENGEQKGQYIIPVKSFLQVNNNETVSAGDLLVKIPREIGKTRDITGGLPRVAELFEARQPKTRAIVSEIEGVVRFGVVKRGVRELIIESEHETKKYAVPHGMHILVHENDFVEAGERLTDGSISPDDILSIKGPGKVQEYLVNEIQEVYRLQGVKINDKHIGVIVRQMLQKVRVDDAGDTSFLPGDQVHRIDFFVENQSIAQKIVVTDPGDSLYREGSLTDKKSVDMVNKDLKKAKKKPVKFRKANPSTFTPLLLGITQAALTTKSFISAASFQETTQVLTEAATAGKEDELIGLKENVIMGHLIPAGTGMSKYNDLGMELEGIEEEEVSPEEENHEENIPEIGMAKDIEENVN